MIVAVGIAAPTKKPPPSLARASSYRVAYPRSPIGAGGAGGGGGGGMGHIALAAMTEPSGQVIVAGGGGGTYSAGGGGGGGGTIGGQVAQPANRNVPPSNPNAIFMFILPARAP